ncbi:MAG TPA: DUF6174 domain-containing protein [Longimicrobium sp.]|nr:DUF6174 domain-containing protein [Longimicrobium sp.]
MIRRIPPLLLALALAACDSPTDPVHALEVNRQIWERHGIDDYRFELRAFCYCRYRDFLAVEVRDGEVVDARIVESGEVLPQERWREAVTMDQLFEFIRGARERGEIDEVRYHPRLGYPLYADLDNTPDDGGVVYEVVGLHRVD